jgi:hypothetical protein
MVKNCTGLRLSRFLFRPVIFIIISEARISPRNSQGYEVSLGLASRVKKTKSLR